MHSDDFATRFFHRGCIDLIPSMISTRGAETLRHVCHTPPPARFSALTLLATLVVQVATENLLKLLQDPAKWDEAREALKTPPLAPSDFKECFRTYSDADPEQHLAFDLYRIQAQDALKVLTQYLSLRGYLDVTFFTDAQSYPPPPAALGSWKTTSCLPFEAKVLSCCQLGR